MYEYRAKVLRWVDGDTVDVEIDLGLKIRVEQRIRLAGINTPETNSRDQGQKTRGIQAVMVAARLAPPSLCVTIRTKKPSPEATLPERVSRQFSQQQSMPSACQGHF